MSTAGAGWGRGTMLLCRQWAVVSRSRPAAQAGGSSEDASSGLSAKKKPLSSLGSRALHDQGERGRRPAIKSTNLFLMGQHCSREYMMDCRRTASLPPRAVGSRSTTGASPATQTRAHCLDSAPCSRDALETCVNLLAELVANRFPVQLLGGRDEALLRDASARRPSPRARPQEGEGWGEGGGLLRCRGSTPRR